jgi:hypothetical protein
VRLHAFAQPLPRLTQAAKAPRRKTNCGAPCIDLPPPPDRKFADSPLEGGVSCELVSEVKFASRAPNGSIPRGLGTILGAVERLFRARTGNNRAKTQHFRHFWMSISRLSNARARARGRFPARGPKVPTPPAGQAG